MYTEDEAKKKWCPHVRFKQLVYNENNNGFEDCIGAVAINTDPDRNDDSFSYCTTSNCMAWRWVNKYDFRDGGYCGLASKPQ